MLAGSKWDEFQCVDNMEANTLEKRSMKTTVGRVQVSNIKMMRTFYEIKMGQITPFLRLVGVQAYNIALWMSGRGRGEHTYNTL